MPQLFRAHLFGAALFLCLTACGGSEAGSSNSTGSVGTPSPEAPSTGGEKTLDEKIAGLEATGALPKLDRSDSLTGPDVNANGIRDDVEAYLRAQQYSAPQLAATLQVARALQSTLTVPLTDKIALNAAATADSRAIDCVYQRFPHDAHPSPYSVLHQIEKITSNTKLRLVSYLKYNDALDGTSDKISEEDTCAQP